jgi:hypothetical protein
VAESCEHGNEPSGSIKRQGISWLAELLLASQVGLCSIEFVYWNVLRGKLHTFFLSVSYYVLWFMPPVAWKDCLEIYNYEYWTPLQT